MGEGQGGGEGRSTRGSRFRIPSGPLAWAVGRRGSVRSVEGGELRLVGVHDLVHDVGNLGVVWLARVDAQGQPLARVRLDVEEERPALVLDLGAPGGRSGRGLAAAEPGPSGEVGLEGAVPRGGGSCVAVA